MCFKLEASTTASSDVHNKQRECHIRLSHTSSCSRHSHLGCSPKPLLPLRTKFAAAADARGDRDASARYSLPCHPGPSSSPSNLAHNLPCARAGSMSAPPLRTRESAPTTRISGQPQSRSRPWLACPRPRQTGRRQPEARRLVGTAERVASLAISLSFSRPRSRDSSFSSFSQLAHASQFPCTSSPRSPTIHRRRSLLEPIAARLLSSDWSHPERLLALPLARTSRIYSCHFANFFFSNARGYWFEQFQMAALAYGGGCECTCA